MTPSAPVKHDFPPKQNRLKRNVIYNELIAIIQKHLKYTIRSAAFPKKYQVF